MKTETEKMRELYDQWQTQGITCIFPINQPSNSIESILYFSHTFTA